MATLIVKLSFKGRLRSKQLLNETKKSNDKKASERKRISSVLNEKLYHKSKVKTLVIVTKLQVVNPYNVTNHLLVY